MSNPNVLSVTPANLATDVILGIQIVVTFDQVIDTTTVTDSTFSVTGPGQTQIVTPVQLITTNPKYLNGREYITGSFTFTTVNNQTVVTFNPSHPFRPNVQYTVLLVGLGSLLISDSITNLTAEPLSANYQWTFTTGDLNTKIPPVQSPTLNATPSIDPKSIKVRINGLNPGDYLNDDIESGTIITLTFPTPIDTTSFDPVDILLSIEQFLGDPTVMLATNLIPTLTVEENIITITLT